MFKCTFNKPNTQHAIENIYTIRDDNDFFYILVQKDALYPIYVDKAIWRLTGVQVQK